MLGARAGPRVPLPSARGLGLALDIFLSAQPDSRQLR